MKNKSTKELLIVVISLKKEGFIYGFQYPVQL